MEYLRGKLRGKTPSWGKGSDVSGYERRGSEDSRGSPFWGRRESGGSLSSLWTRTSRNRNGTSSWNQSDERGSTPYMSDYTCRTATSSQYPPTPTSPTPGTSLASPWRVSSGSDSSAQTPTADCPWRIRGRASPSPCLKDRTVIPQRQAKVLQSPPPPNRPPPRKTHNYPWRLGRASKSPPPPPHNSEVDENMNYKTMFEKEKQEKELYESKLAEMEQQHQMLENNLKKFLDLKKELTSFQREAEESDRVVNDFIKAVVPDFTTIKKEDDERKNKKIKTEGKPPLPSQPSQAHHNHHIYRANIAQADPDLPMSPPPPGPPLPIVQYEWDDAYTSPSPINPVGRYSYSTTSRCTSRLDELKLNLVFDVNSRQLPTKLQLEIKDRKGRVVFRKRQNLYYVKVQERLATLDAEDDYIMTVTSICGPTSTSEEVPIHNKYYSPPDTEVTEPYPESLSMSLPVLETCRSPSEASFTSGFDERSIDSIFDTPLKNIEATYDEVCREASETPMPDLEEIVEVEFTPALIKKEVVPIANNQVEQELIVTEKKNPFLLLKKPIIPEVLYKWQHGFRRGPGSQYRKVPILKLQFKYEEVQTLLPGEVHISGAGDHKRVTISQKVANAEFVVEEGVKVHLSVVSKDKTGQDDLTAPPFRISPENFSDSLLGDWLIVQPTLTIDLS